MKNDKGLFIKDPNFWRVPRKLKKQIPKNTPYCYTPTSTPGIMKDGRWGYTIKPCPLYTWKKYKDMIPTPKWMDKEDMKKYGEDSAGYCKLVKGEIDDQCKNCGISCN
jgi:hypothetical protein